MDNPIITTASFCSGVAWLDEGVRLGCEYFGWRAKSALMCEWESYASATLLARMEESSLEPAPISPVDMRDFDGRPFHGLVDIAIAGLPCQPYSLAGQQRGNADERSFGAGDGPLPNFLRIVSECRPAVVFLENVPAWVCGGWFRPFGEELCRMGYKIEEPIFVTAESLGASHRRERVFIVAHRAGERFGKAWPAAVERRSADMLANCHLELADAGCSPGHAEYGNEQGSGIRRRSPTADAERVGPSGGEMADAKRPAAYEPDASGRYGAAGFVAESGELVGEPTSRKRRIDQPGRGKNRRTAAGRAGGAMGDAEHGATGNGSTGQKASTPSRKRRRVQRPSDSSGVLGDASQSGLPQPECDQLSGPERFDQGRAVAQSDRAPIFAPGPKADWRAIPEMFYPALEPGFRLLVDGSPVVLDASRSDQLRCAGNGCMAIQAAIAFIELVRRIQT